MNQGTAWEGGDLSDNAITLSSDKTKVKHQIQD